MIKHFNSVLSLYHNNYTHFPGLSQLNGIRDSLQIHGFIKADVDNMEVCHKSPPSTNVSNKKMVSDVQLLPFMDYFFILYSSDLLHKNPLPATHDALIKIGCEYLCVDPKHLGNILRCLKANIHSGTRKVSSFLVYTNYTSIR